MAISPSVSSVRDHAFWVRHLRLTAGYLWATAAVCVPYVWVSDAHPGLLVLAGLVLLAGVAAAAVRRLAVQRLIMAGRMDAVGVAIALALLALSSGAVLLDAPDSPLRLLLVMPMVFAGTALRPTLLIWFGAVAVGVMAATTLAAGVAAAEVVLLGGIQVATAVALSTLVVSQERQATQDRQVRDPRSGALTRQGFLDALEGVVDEAMEDAEPVALLVAAVDGCQRLAAAHGLAAAEAAVVRVAQHIRAAAPEPDLVGQVGEDQFAVILPGADQLGAQRVAEQIARAGRKEPVSVNVGLSRLPDLAGDPTTLLEQAADASLSARRGGGGNGLRSSRVAWFGAQPGQPIIQHALAAADRTRARRVLDAIEEGRVTSYRQPIRRLDDGTIIAYEALARIAGSRLSPARWLEVAAEVGLRDELEAAMWEAAIADPPHTLLFLNASPAALLNGVLERMAPRMPPRLVIEVSEHEAVDDYQALASCLDRWRDRGALVAVDDFGAGHANLLHVLRLRPDYLKLDRSLVTDVDTQSRHGDVIISMMSLAERVGAQLIAEGIETAAQAASLLTAGVVLGQGYLLGVPEPVTPRPQSRHTPPGEPAEQRDSA